MFVPNQIPWNYTVKLTFQFSTDEILTVYKMGEKPPKLNANVPITPSGEPSIGSGNLSTSKKK